ncbi:DUF4892 domain-containing protein [Marinomonas agarivorans]|nr:DUF4892 domain-containing protein [Marinomonas agarivorans]
MRIRSLLTISLLGWGIFTGSYAKELPLTPLSVKEYRGVEVLKRDVVDNTDYILPLSKIKRSAGRDWQPEEVRFLQGNISRSLYKFGRSADLQAIYSHYYSEILHDAEILFECAGRNCGSSNAWANNFFKEYRLYGSDDSQFLIVTKHTSQPLYRVLYLNRRGAGDIFVRLDHVTAAERVVDTTNSSINSPIALQTEINDFLRIRRYIETAPANKSITVLVTTSKRLSSEQAVQQGRAYIKSIKKSLGERLVSRVTFINLAAFGQDEFGEDLVTLLR